MKQIRLIVLFLFFATCSEAQVFKIDFELEPKPYTEAEYYGETVGNGLKSVTQINTVNINRGISNDTIVKYEYGKEGRRARTILYSKNKVNKIHDFIYEIAPNKVVLYTKSKNKITDIHETFYDNAKNVVGTRSYVMNVNDTLHVWATNFKFENNKLLIRENKIDGNYNGITEYFWDNELLSKAIFYSDVNNKQYYYEYKYTYDKNKMLVESALFQQRNTIRDSVSYNKYSYSGNLMVEEKYSGINSSKEETIATYKYDNNGKLQEIDASRANDKLLIVYEYDNQGKLKSKSVKTNTTKLFKQLFLLVPYDTKKDNPYNVIQNFEYDKNGNLISISHYSNQKLIYKWFINWIYY